MGVQSAQKVSVLTKISYGIGQMGDSIPFNVFYIYFLFFLTDVAGVSPGIAGMVSLIAVLWDAITDPVIGYLSDNSKSKYGRRRPLMLIGSIPLAISLLLLFTSVDFNETYKNIYYIAVSMVFWTSYTAYVIPYFALGAEITQDFNERNSLRTYASVFMYTAVLIASAAPMWIVGSVGARGGTAQMGWTVVGGVFGVLTFIAIFACWRSTRGQEIIVVQETSQEKENIFKTYMSTLKLKPYRYIITSVLLLAATTAMGSTAIVYLMSSNMGLNEGQQSLFWIVNTASAIVWLPLINYSANKYGKKATYITFITFSAVIMGVFMITGFGSFTSLMAYALIFSFGMATFWTLSYSMMYDCCELDEFVSGQRREGAITSLTSFFQKLGAAGAMWFTGLILESTGYVGSASVQTESALKGIVMACTIIPAGVALAGALILIKYPLNEKRFEELKEAVELKKLGKEFTNEEVKSYIS